MFAGLGTERTQPMEDGRAHGGGTNTLVFVGAKEDVIKPATAIEEIDHLAVSEAHLLGESRWTSFANATRESIGPRPDGAEERLAKWEASLRNPGLV